MFGLPGADGHSMKATLAHAELDILERQILGKLTAIEEQTVDEHLLICDKCRAMSGALEREINQIRRALLAAESPMPN